MRSLLVNQTNSHAADLLHNLPNDFCGEVRTDPYNRLLYATDASIYQVVPLAVVLPRTREDVQMVVEACAREHISLLPRGGGSSLAGQAIGQAVVVDFSRYLNRIVETNREEHWVRVEPGTVCDHLKKTLVTYGLQYGCDPASSNRATLGGMVANNSTGAHSMLYGMTADHIIEADVILADGSLASFAACAHNEPLPTGDSLATQIQNRVAEIVARDAHHIRERYPRTWRTSSGYRLNYLVPPSGFSSTHPSGWRTEKSYPDVRGFNLAQLLAGSEGTLAMVTELKMNLVPLPHKTTLALLQFNSVAAACDATPAILATKPSAVELIDQMLLRLTQQIPAYSRMLTFIEGDPAAVLIVEYYGHTETELTHKLDRLENLMCSSDLPSRPTAIRRAMTERDQTNVWGVRKVSLGLLMSIQGDAKPIPFIEDAAVPVEHLGAYVREVERLFADHGVKAGYYAHASAGCLHIRPLINTKDRDQVATMRAVAEGVLEIVIRLRGAMSGEHSDGLARSCWNERLFGPELYSTFREIKRVFDPQNIFNPGKVVDAADMTENLRYGPHYQTIDLQTHLDFSREGGFARAVEQCNGAGICRKSDGVMCPSFQVTREEEHSTRGRANALRAALSGILPPSALTDKRMHEVLDLCLSCKACKAECPSAVDMAKIKAEFMAHYISHHSVSLNALLLANLNALSRWAHRFAPLVNPLMHSVPIRWLNEKLFGIAQQRQLPAFAWRTFRSQYRCKETVNGPTVVLFTDTFTDYYHPEIGLAAVKVLNAAGFAVQLVDKQGCCGRPMISTGLLNQARSCAQRNVAALAPYAEQGIPIVGLEPACLLTLRDEYLDFLPGDEAAQAVAQHSFMIEEFLSSLAERGESKIKWRTQSRKVIVHGHCHQNALIGTSPLLTMLRLPGWDVEEIPSGCCGMAGAWGYKADHYSMSQTIGEDRLFPEIRAAAHETLIVASGGSCRDQIAHFTDRTAKHPISLLAAALHTKQLNE